MCVQTSGGSRKVMTEHVLGGGLYWFWKYCKHALVGGVTWYGLLTGATYRDFYVGNELYVSVGTNFALYLYHGVRIYTCFCVACDVCDSVALSMLLLLIASMS